MKISSLTSTQNPNYKKWLSLLQTKGVRKTGLCLVSGRKIVPELATENCTVILAEQHRKHLGNIIGKEAYVLSAKMFAELDEFGTNFPLIIKPIPRLQTFDLGKQPQGLELVICVQDPQNLGAIIRTAVAFGVNKIICRPECPEPYSHKVTRSSSGVNFQAPLFKSETSWEKVAECYALDLVGENIFKAQLPTSLRLLVGEEGRGVTKAFSGPKLFIPMTEKVESLNAGVAAAVALAIYKLRTG